MVVLNVKVDGKDTKLYSDGGLKKQLDAHVIPAVQKKDFDYLLIVDGEEGSGKSVFSMQLAKILDPNFCLSQVVFTPKEFIKAIVDAKPHSCIVFDEAFTGLSSRSSLSEVNQLLVSLMMEMRQKNLFVIVVMPTFFMLDRYVILHRARGLFHVYLHGLNRGYWRFFSKDRMKYLYLAGKKMYSYTAGKHLFFGRFLNQYMVNEDEYRVRKRASFSVKKRTTSAEKYKFQRDVLFWILHNNTGLKHTEIAKLCKEQGYSLVSNNISMILSKFAEVKEKNEERIQAFSSMGAKNQ